MLKNRQMYLKYLGPAEIYYIKYCIILQATFIINLN